MSTISGLSHMWVGLLLRALLLELKGKPHGASPCPGSHVSRHARLPALSLVRAGVTNKEEPGRRVCVCVCVCLSVSCRRLSNLFRFTSRGARKNTTVLGPTVDGRNPAPLGNHGKPLFVGIYMGIDSFQGFLGGAKWISSIHNFDTYESQSPELLVLGLTHHRFGGHASFLWEKKCHLCGFPREKALSLA